MLITTPLRRKSKRLDKRSKEDENQRKKDSRTRATPQKRAADRARHALQQLERINNSPEEEQDAARIVHASQQLERMHMCGRLRDRLATIEDWRTVNATCSTDLMSEERKLLFDSNLATWIFYRNSPCHAHNVTMLRRMQSPVLRVDAEHDCKTSRKRCATNTEKLETSIYLCIGAKIQLLQNAAQPWGLANGVTGTIKGFQYDSNRTDNCHTTMPNYYIVEFASYTGPPFYTDPTMSKYVALCPSKCNWTDIKGDDHFRKQFPISLAWGITVWKSQGSTFSDPIRLELTNKELACGGTYVCWSRATDINNVCVGSSIPLDRLTTAISNSDVLQRRLIEDKRLKELNVLCKQFYFPLFNPHTS
jgi:hypothetical protein